MQNDIVRQPPQPKEEPNTQVQPLQDVQPSQPSVAPQNIVEQAPVQSQPEQTTQEPEVTTDTTETEAAEQSATVKHKSNKPIGVIVTAVIVCTGLVGGAIYGATQQSGKDSNVATTNTAQPTTTQADDTLSEVDAALEETNNIQNTPQDLSTEMSDASLGL